MSENQNIEVRKRHHIELAKQAQVTVARQNADFDYEPIFSAHPMNFENNEISFLSKKLKAPLWISSMTGGTGSARHINQNLAQACRQFGLGMGLGSIRPLLSSNEFFEDFNLRPVIGDDLPLFANIGICQLEELLLQNKISKLEELCKRLCVDGIIIHLNVLQEYFQPEGDRLSQPPIETIQKFLDKWSLPVIVKEVGQGMGPLSLRELMKLPLAAIEFGAFGGTNFSYLEMLRNNEDTDVLSDLAFVGHSADEMVSYVNQILSTEKNILCRQFIISGGITSVLHGYALTEKCLGNSLIGRASAYLQHAENFEELEKYIRKELEALAMAKAFLKIK